MQELPRRCVFFDFYPRPPQGGRPTRWTVHRSTSLNFYPRPPQGGRPLVIMFRNSSLVFLSTPSARRATFFSTRQTTSKGDFYPRPPQGGRRIAAIPIPIQSRISIHALRKEGDIASCYSELQQNNFYPRPPQGGRLMLPMFFLAMYQFLSTPSARRATRIPPRKICRC